jgi:hypothetical protein
MLTEGLFLILALPAMGLLWLHLERSNFVYLILASVLSATAFLARYSGAGLVAAGGLGILLLSSKPWLRRFVDAIIFGAISTLPGALWLASNPSPDRGLAFHPIPLQKLASGGFTIAKWVLPEGFIRTAAQLLVSQKILLVIAGGIGLAVIAGILFLIVRQLRKPNSWGNIRQTIVNTHRLPALFALFAVVYTVFLIFSISFLDAYTYLESRIMLPVHAAMLVVVCYVGYRILEGLPTQSSWRRIVLAVSIVFAGSYALRGITEIVQDYKTGVGYQNESWRNSSFMEQIRQLPADARLFSNNPEVIYLLTDKAAKTFPLKYNFTSLKPNPKYESEIADMVSQIKTNNSFIIYFSDGKRQHLPTNQELQALLPLEIIAQEREGLIYKAT